jgi:hypothetical protein
MRSEVKMSHVYQYPLRMPHALRSRIAARAAEEQRSFNRQLLALVEDGLAQQDTRLPTRAVAQLLREALGEKA